MKISIYAVLVTAFVSVAIGEACAATAYVAKNGNDSTAVVDDPDLPFASIQSAVTALGSAGGTVSVAAGTYKETTATTCVTISAPVEVIGATGDPEDVIVTRDTQAANIFKLDHAGAKIKYLTAYGGLHTGAGAYVTSNGGTIEDCIFDSNRPDDWCYTGGIKMEAGTASRIIVRNHTSHNHTNIRGVGILMEGNAVCEDSLFYNNKVGPQGVVYLTGKAVLRNCTVADNFGEYQGFIGVWTDSTSCKVENCLIFGNWAWGAVEGSYKKKFTEVYRGRGARFFNCVSDAEIPSSTDCQVISVNPFVDPANGDYHITAALRERPTVGCYPVSAAAFSADFRIKTDSYLVNTSLTFQAGAVGASGSVTYAWDFGDGTTLAASADEDVSHEYTAAGNYTITMTASDGVSSFPKAHSVKIGVRSVTVSSAADIQPAIDAAIAGTVIHLAAGVYKPSATINVNKGVTLVGDEGAQQTVIDGSQHRVFYMNDGDAVIKNITITNGKDNNGAGVYIDENGGMLEGCIITNNIHDSYATRGTGVYMKNGRIQRCVIARNSCQGHNESYAPGVMISCGQVLNSLIAENTNCKIGGAIRAVGGSVRVVNCTIVANSGAGYPAVYCESKDARFVNCAIFDNIGTGTDQGKVFGLKTAECVAAFVNCACFYDVSLTGGTDWKIGSAAFVDGANHNYRLGGSASICYDNGCDPSAYATLGDLDLDGNPRQKDQIDIGCFENQKDQIAFDFTVATDRYILPASVTLTPAVDGSEDPYTVDWYVSNTVSGVVTHFVGDDDPYVWNDAGTGLYSIWAVAHVGLRDVESVVHSECLQLSTKDLYVLPVNDNAEWPYDTAAKAATNIADAVRTAANGAIVHVLPGETGLHFRYEQADLTRAITIVGEAPDRGIMITNAVRSGVSRFFKLDHPESMVANFTFAGGYSFGDLGANFYFTPAGGTVSNCLIKSGYAVDYNGVGGVAFMYGGLITHCEITGEFCSRSHHTDGNTQSAILICNSGMAKVQNCFVHDITFAHAGDTYYNTGALIHGKYIDNVTIVNADIPDTNWGSATLLSGCGIRAYDNMGPIRNCVVVNVRSQRNDCLKPYAVGNDKTNVFVNCASDVTPINPTCVQSTMAQMFVNPAAGDYSPKTKGPLYDAGVEVPEFAATTDILGHPRVFHEAIDIGAFESQLKIGTTIIYR